MRHGVANNGLVKTAHFTAGAVEGTIVFLIRACALVVFILMSFAEPFFAVVLSTLAIGCFAVSVLFGFIFHAYFPHRWYVLGASVVFMLMYFLYRIVMLGVQRLLR